MKYNKKNNVSRRIHGFGKIEGLFRVEDLFVCNILRVRGFSKSDVATDDGKLLQECACLKKVVFCSPLWRFGIGSTYLLESRKKKNTGSWPQSCPTWFALHPVSPSLQF